jgi:hypothetical protein
MQEVLMKTRLAWMWHDLIDAAARHDVAAKKEADRLRVGARFHIGAPSSSGNETAGKRAMIDHDQSAWLEAHHALSTARVEARLAKHGSEAS